MVLLEPNTKAFTLPDVKLSNGSVIDLSIGPGEIWSDPNGVVHQYSTVFSDGVHGNYWLHHRKSTRNEVLDSAADFVVGLGLTIVGNLFFRGSKPVHNVARYMTQAVGERLIGPIVGPIVDLFKEPDWAYFEMTTGERVIDNVIDLKAKFGE